MGYRVRRHGGWPKKSEAAHQACVGYALPYSPRRGGGRRHPDGSFTFDRKPFPTVTNIVGCTALGFLVGLVLAAPLTGAAIGALLGGTGTATSAAVGIDDDFRRGGGGADEARTSALFVLDDEGDMDVILHEIRGRAARC